MTLIPLEFKIQHREGRSGPSSDYPLKAEASHPIILIDCFPVYILYQIITILRTKTISCVTDIYYVLNKYLIKAGRDEEKKKRREGDR